jgi:hypothetical protein
MRYLILILVSVLFCVGCDDTNDPTSVSNNSHTPSVVDYGNGVYYFGLNRSEFGNALSAFLSSHPCHLEGITGNGTGLYGLDLGYFVICR